MAGDLNYIDPSGHDPWWLQEPWYEDPVPNQPKTDSMGIDKQQLRMRLFMSNSVCCERQAIAGTHKERIDQSIKVVTPKEWHDELDEINAFLDEWYPVLEFGLSIAMMTSGGPPSRLPGQGINVKAKWGNPRSIPAYGHSFSQHGPKLKAQQLIDRARGKQVDQGQWYNEMDIVMAEQLAPLESGSHLVDMSKAIGRVYRPDGSIVEDVTYAIVVRKQNLAVRTAYPIIKE